MDLYAIRNELSQGRSVFDLPLRVTYYARVSSSSDEQLHSLAAQSDYYQTLIGANANWQYVPGYIDAPDILGLKQNPTKRASL